jgi:hypothetical protein
MTMTFLKKIKMQTPNQLKAAALIEHLILQNALEIDGFDIETGETIYSITDNLEFVNPELYEDLREDFNHQMFEMVRQGPTIMKWKIDGRFFNG